MANPADDRDPLLTVAASISDGNEIDWTDVGREVADDETTAVVMQLRVVEQIARLHLGSQGWDSLKLLGTIGRGSFGVVHRAFDPDLEREIALKVLGSGRRSPAPPIARSTRRGCLRASRIRTSSRSSGQSGTGTKSGCGWS